MKSRKLLDSFHAYCLQYPDQRFWQALRNWSGQSFIGTAKTPEGKGFLDTFYWEGKSGRSETDN